MTYVRLRIATSPLMDTDHRRLKAAMGRDLAYRYMGDELRAHLEITGRGPWVAYMRELGSDGFGNRAWRRHVAWLVAK